MVDPVFDIYGSRAEATLAKFNPPKYWLEMGGISLFMWSANNPCLEAHYCDLHQMPFCVTCSNTCMYWDKIIQDTIKGPHNVSIVSTIREMEHDTISWPLVNQYLVTVGRS